MTAIIDTVSFDAAFWLLAGIALVAGVARGMSGFGTGMIIAPVAGALYGPQIAIAVIVLIDSLPSIPVTIPALKIARWREVLPVVAGIALLLPFGVYLVQVGDPVVLRWAICFAILACVAVLWSGWRYQGPRNLPVSLGVGGVAGVLSGIASIPGPPVIFYWMSAGLPAVIVRANLLALFLLGEFLSIANLWWAGLFTREALGLSLLAAPPYFLGLIVGARLFGQASDATYRRVTFVLIVLSAVLALPPLTDAIRAGAAAIAN